MSAIISSLTAQLQELKSNINEVAQIADSAMELGLASQEQDRQLRLYREWVTENIIHLDNQIWAHNIKQRGFQEGAEETTDLAIFIASWMASVLHLDDQIVQFIDVACRLGPPGRAKSDMPWDILVWFADLRLKQWLLTEVRSKGFLQPGTNKTLGFPDFSAEMLEACHQLHPVTSLLNKFNHR